MELLLGLPWYLLGFLFVAIFTLLVLVGHVILRPYVSSKILETNQNFSGIAFNVVGVLYAVLLGMTILDAKDRFREVSKNAETEANLIADLFRDAIAFAPEERQKIRHLLREYIDTVINEEWSMMAKGEYSLRTSDAVQGLWLAYHDIDPSTPKLQAWYSLSIQHLNDINNYRFMRLFNSHQFLGPLMWTLLIVGGFILTGFVYFFWVENVYLQAIMTILIACNVAYMLFLTFVFDNQYIGDQGIQPVALERVLTAFNRWEETQ